MDVQTEAKLNVRKQRQEESRSMVSNIKPALSDSLKHAMELAQEKGASTWLTSLPLDEFGFSLHKGAFRDALALRYGWLPSNTPINCPCETHFSVEHALSCPKGGFPSIRHMGPRVLGVMLVKVCCIRNVKNSCAANSCNSSGMEIYCSRLHDAAAELPQRALATVAVGAKERKEKHNYDLKHSEYHNKRVPAVLQVSMQMLHVTVLYSSCTLPLSPA